MIVDVDEIEVGIPKFKWLMGRLSTEDFKQYPEYEVLKSEGSGSREALLDKLEHEYARFLELPILVEQCSHARYKIKDGHRRLAVLVGRRKKRSVSVVLWQEGWGKAEWEESRLVDLMVQQRLVNIPQKHLLKGSLPYNLTIDGKQIDSFLVSAGVQIPHILFAWDKPECRGDDFKGEWVPRPEVLYGVGKHPPIAKEWGTQPLNVYIAGHFCFNPIDAVVQQSGPYVRIQQYFQTGYYGTDTLPDWPYRGRTTVIEQIIQNNYAIPLMFRLGLLTPETPIYFSDQSADKPCAYEKYFRLFKGKDALQQYYRWLPTYFRECLRNRFKEPIERVIEMIPH